MISGTRTFIPWGVGPCLLLLAMLTSCSEVGSDLPRVFRLADPGLIAAVESPYKEAMEGRSLLIEKVPPLVELDHTTEWHPFHAVFELAVPWNKELGKPGSFSPENPDRTRLIPPGTGLAYIVAARPETKLFIECKGRFDSSSYCNAAVIQLDSRPKLPPSAEPGAVKKIVQNTVKKHARMTRLQPSEDGRSAKCVFELSSWARAVLILVMATGGEQGALERVCLTPFKPINDFLYQRLKRGLDHPALARTPFIEATVRPSFLLFPDSFIRLKPVKIPESAELHCALGLVDRPPAPLTLTWKARDEDGGEHELFRRTLDSKTKGWIEVKKDLSPFSGRELTFTLACACAGKVTVNRDQLPSPICCGSPAIHRRDTSTEKEELNLILISLDTLRQDRLGCYGYERPVSPNMDRFAKEGFLFRRFYSQAPYTLPSHASLFSSLYPSVHGMHKSADYMPDGMEPLAEILARNGLTTASFNNGGFVSHELGFHRGFDLYCEVDPIGDRYRDGKPFSNPNCLADGSSGSLGSALSWIREMKEDRFFLFLHTFMIHEYLPPKELASRFNKGCASSLKPETYDRRKINQDHVKEHGLSKEDLAFFKNMYDASIRASDDMVGQVLSHLEALSLLDKTIVVITSDHGEEFMEHGSVQHGKSVYDELILVPLLMHVPGLKGAVEVDALVNQVDLMPTLLEIMDIPVGKDLQGHSVLPLMSRSQGKPRVIYAETEWPSKYSQRCIIREGWKYVEGNTDKSLDFPAPAPAELFRLDEDPGEQRNLLEMHPDTAEQYKSILNKLTLNLQRIREALKIEPGSPADISEKLKEVLQQQGYL